jgi:hypothetical protein
MHKITRVVVFAVGLTLALNAVTLSDLIARVLLVGLGVGLAGMAVASE